MKHGPIALIDENMPVVVIAPHDAVYRRCCRTSRK
jgi:glutamine---fructose-6-phosphate transaminase (isomerizing)